MTVSPRLIQCFFAVGFGFPEASELRGPALHHLLVARHGERREHQVRLQRLHALDIDVQVGADLRKRGDDVLWEVRMIIHAHEQMPAAQRADDLGVRAGQGDDSHGDGLPRSHEAVRAVRSRGELRAIA